MVHSINWCVCKQHKTWNSKWMDACVGGCELCKWGTAEVLEVRFSSAKCLKTKMCTQCNIFILSSSSRVLQVFSYKRFTAESHCLSNCKSCTFFFCSCNYCLEEGKISICDCIPISFLVHILFTVYFFSSFSETNSATSKMVFSRERKEGRQREREEKAEKRDIESVYISVLSVSSTFPRATTHFFPSALTSLL